MSSVCIPLHGVNLVVRTDWSSLSRTWKNYFLNSISQSSGNCSLKKKKKKNIFPTFVLEKDRKLAYIEPD